MSTEIVTVEPRELAPSVDLGAVVGAWLADLEPDTTADTRRTYARLVGRFVDWHIVRGPVDGAAVRAWLADVGGSPATRNLHLASLRSFTQWAQRAGHIPTDPTAGVKGARRKGTSRRHKRDALSASEVRAMLEACEDTPTGRRDAAVIALMAYLGLRTVEVQRADVSDVGRHSGRRVLLIRGKGSAGEPLPGVLDGEAWAIVRRWLDVRPGDPQSGPLLTTIHGGRLSRRTIRHAVKRRMAEAGIVGPDRMVTTHSLRHTAITQVLLAGGTIRQAQALARHASVTTTEVYAHELDRMADAPEDLISYAATSER